MNPEFADDLLTLYRGDCRQILPRLPAASISALVTDPPAGIGFRGLAWDRAPDRSTFIAFISDVMRECRRVLQPGAHALVWAIPRTSHWTATAIEDAGFEIRDVVTHLFASGMPKSLDCGRAQHEWSGWGTALKPASEHWILARVPLAERTIAANLELHGAGALHIDACRVPGETSPSVLRRRSPGRYAEVSSFRDPAHRHDLDLYRRARPGEQLGRWPANVVLSDEQLLGSAAKFFYVAKARARETRHPTAKSVELMRHLVALVTPPQGTVLDCFAGSGTTLLAARDLGLRAIGIERDAGYVGAAARRLRSARVESMTEAA